MAVWYIEDGRALSAVFVTIIDGKVFLNNGKTTEMFFDSKQAAKNYLYGNTNQT